MKNIFKIKNLIAALCMSATFATSMASSHREAPMIANDPLADNCDLYAFRSPNDTNMITLIATYVPMQSPQGGPNYNSFGEHIRYEIHVDNNTATPGDDITYRFTFTKVNQDPTTFFNIRLGQQNLKTTYTLEKSTNGGASFTTIITNGIVPPPNIGDRSIASGVGLNTSYNTLFMNAITNASSGEKVFCGTSDDPFYVDLGGVFDLGDLKRASGNSKDGLKYLNVSTIAIQVPISSLQKTGQSVTNAANILDPNFVIGVWASASRQQIKTIAADGSEAHSGAWIQVSRLGMPLTNEAVIPIGKKDLWNSITPYQDLAYLDTFKNFFYNPELALYMDDSLFGGAVPAFSALRIQRNSLQSFDFGNGHDGLFGLKGNPALAGTALDDAIFGTLLLPAAGSPRSVDLWPIFHTGVPNLAPYHLATGKGGNPLANGKPFINNFLPNGGDMLRLNMAVPVTQRNDPNFSADGIINAAVLGLTSPTYNTNTNLEFIPNMDGFPNGRRLEDDVTKIELQAVAGVALAAIGLWYDDYTVGGANPVTTDLLDVLTYETGVEMNDTTFRTSFPFVQQPWSGTGPAGGLEVAFNQTPCLDVMPPFTIMITNVQKVNNLCGNVNNGSIQVTATGAAGISYNLMPTNVSNNSGVFVNLSPNIYTITASAAHASSSTTIVTITGNSPLILSTMQGNNITCFGKSDGTFSSVATGGVSPYSFSVNPVKTQPAAGQFIGIAAGTYTVTVADNVGCISTKTIAIMQPTAITYNSVVPITPLCNGMQNGSLFSTVNGGTAPYSYSLTPSNGMQPSIGNFINLPSTIYIVRATDANGCTKSSAVLLPQPAPLKLASISKANIDCNGSNTGSIGATTKGGVGSKVFSLNPVGMSTGTSSFGALPANNYTLIAIDANQCSVSTIVTITQATAITWNNILTSNANNGTIVVSAIGGIGSKTYSILPNIGSQNISGSFFGLASGNYTLTATDSRNCTKSTTVTLVSASIALNSSNGSIIDEENNINIYPNPTDGKVSISFAVPMSSSITIHVFDMQGKNVQTVESQLDNLENKISLRLDDLITGKYIIQVVNNGEIILNRVVEKK